MKKCCEQKVKFDKRIVFCPDCGTKHNRESRGLSRVAYANHMEDTLLKKLKQKVYYFKGDTSYKKGGTFSIWCTKAEIQTASGYIDAPKVELKYLTTTRSIRYQTDGKGSGKPRAFNRCTFDYHTITDNARKYEGSKRLTFTEDEVFDTPEDHFDVLVLQKMIGTYKTLISKEEFDATMERTEKIRKLIEEELNY